eukprot:gene25120-33638_t
MEYVSKQPEKLTFLVCADVDGPSSLELAEYFVPTLKPRFDAVLVCGPFTHQNISSDEQRITAEGDIASIIAQFENVVCRVIYLPTEKDPPNTLVDQMYLTPNSVGIHGRKLRLAPTLSIYGFAERSGDISNANTFAEDDNNNEEEHLNSVEVKSGLSVSIINEIINAVPEESSSVASSSPEIHKETGIFMLNYKFAHTLNQFLFHLSDKLERAGIDLVVITSDNLDETSSRLPSTFGSLHIVAPKSLRLGRFYSVVEMVFEADSNRWKVESVSAHCLRK